MASLACTSCRAKKRRCDRVLPSCMQCINAQQPCQYPDQHKRGLPAGFLNAMESRLRETEDALFYALSELYEGTIQDREYAGLSDLRLGRRSSSQSTTASKSDMMDKWANLPLGNRTQVRAWFLNHRVGNSSSPTIQLDSQPERQSPSSSPVRQRGQDGPGHGGNVARQSSRQVSPPPQSSSASDSCSRSQELGSFASRTTATVPPLTSATSMYDGLGLSTRVKAVAESNKRIYF
ncbi:hypothetical protein F5Y09DRAFT_161995 [Xylaria sp. FL1042]|nr:hypothetical protein F5Y09DRAFT_161995 [Xylaria sp. FL1042]